MADESRCPEMIECITSCNHIDCLCDELLREILLRLPNCRNVIQSMCVCRRWNALASHPMFLADFIRFKIENGAINLNYQHGTFAFVTLYEPDIFTKLWQQQEFESFFRPSIFQLQDSSFSPLDCLKDDEDAHVSASTLVASCQDLLLYCRHENDKYDFYISNVQTQESVMLPSPPSNCTNQHHLVGFICDPFYYYSGREISINSAYNYTVVICRAPCRSTEYRAHLFSSHCDTQWCEKVLSLPEQCDLWRSSSTSFCFCFDGKLHFSGRQGFFGFDHNSIGSQDEIQCHFIQWPLDMLRGNHRVGVSQGRLHVSAWVSETATLKVWVLEDYKAGSWMSLHSVELSDWVPRHPFITDELQKFAHHRGQLRIQTLIRVLGLHPSRSDAIYLLVPGYIFLCDLSTKAVELACRIPVAIAEKYSHYLSRFYVFPVIFHTWPTPLPPLAQGQVGVNTTLAD